MYATQQADRRVPGVVSGDGAPPAPGRRRWLAALVLLSLGAAVQAEAELSPKQLYRGLEAAAPDGRTVDVTGLTLTRDVFEIEFTSGRFYLLGEVAGETPGALFVGRGSYALTPLTAVERRYVARRSGDRSATSFSDTFDEALLLFADGTEAELLAAGSAGRGAIQPSTIEKVRDRLKLEEGRPGVDYHLRLLRSRLNDEGHDSGPFFALIKGGSLERAVLAVDEMGLVDGEGACLMVESGADAGYWYSSPTRGQLERGAGGAPRRLVDARHYKIDSRVARSTDLEGVTTVKLKVEAASLGVLPVDLLPSLRIRGAGIPGLPAGAVDFVQAPEESPGSAALLFRPPLTRGTVVELRIEYGGDGVLIDDGAKIYQVRGRTNWYPSFGAFRDRAAYDMRFRVPKGNTVVAVGEHVSTKESDGQVVSIWRSKQPITVAGFNYGDFRRTDREEKNTGVAIEVYATNGTPDVVEEINQQLQQASSGLDFRGALTVAADDSISAYVNTYTGPSSIGVSPESLTEVAMADAVNSVQLFTGFFGPLPNRRIAVTQQSQWSFGQAWPSLVYLPYLLGLSNLLQVELGLDGYAGFVDQVGIHEIAHQWWGHKVGWTSYRDQWLSEGFAEFSTALVLEATQGAEAHNEFWEQRRRAILGRQKGDYVAAYAVGPVTLGFRAADARSPGAAQALMYSKGAYVLHMLRMMMRDRAARSDERFFSMMRDFATSFAGRTASTEDFKAHVQKHMVPELNATRDGKIDWFFDQWVYGTEVPQYKSEVAIEKVGKNKYRLVGTLTQSAVSDSFVALVPTYVDFGKGNYAQFGRAPMRGESTMKLDVTLDLPKKPKGVVVNAHHEVLAFD